ncbi:MAG: dihydropteroate synthase [Prevotellaceae bacterium]|nr:dihydropteroate synthase [Prevotellaceae bacterium]
MNMQISIHNKTLDLSSPQVMGILNVTPDSFYAGSRKQTEQEIAERTNQIISEGATSIDVGAFSTRPGPAFVSEEEEIQRMRNGLAIVRKEQPDAILSIDTFRPAVARMAVEEFGADIINDISEGRGYYNNTANANAKVDVEENENEPSDILLEVARLKVPYILMSLQPDLDSTVSTFIRKLKTLTSIGVKDIILDPGYGFGKDIIKGNYSLLAAQQELKDTFHLPLLVGISRKRMIWQLLDSNADEALNGTTALNMLALDRGADILRVHDVSAAVEATKIYLALRENSQR